VYITLHISCSEFVPTSMFNDVSNCEHSSMEGIYRLPQNRVQEILSEGVVVELPVQHPLPRPPTKVLNEFVNGFKDIRNTTNGTVRQELCTCMTGFWNLEL